MKLVWLIALGCLLFRMIAGRWPWQSKVAIGQRRALDAARILLGVSATADRSAIIEAHRLALTRVHPDRGGSNEAVHEVNAARDLLLAELPALPIT